MECSLLTDELKKYVDAQLKTFFPDGRGSFSGADVDRALEMALSRVEFCFQHIKLKGYQEAGQACFSHLHSDQYSQFLYYLSNSLWQMSGNKLLCDKLILLNRALHGCWFSYKGRLPAIFLLGHPVGSVLGNAVYSNYLVVLQNVTVNTEVDVHGNMAPVLGKGLFLSAGAKIIGNQPIGDWVQLGVNVCVNGEAVPAHSVVYHDRKNGAMVRRPYRKIPVVTRYFLLDEADIEW